VPRRVKRAAAGFYARARDYRQALEASGTALEQTLARHLGDADATEPRIGALAAYVRAAAASLAVQHVEELIEGRPSFSDPKGVP
jgi:cytochrome b pre-mRNA-processing protein 3